MSGPRDGGLDGLGARLHPQAAGGPRAVPRGPRGVRGDGLPHVDHDDLAIPDEEVVLAEVRVDELRLPNRTQVPEYVLGYGTDALDVPREVPERRRVNPIDLDGLPAPLRIRPMEHVRLLPRADGVVEGREVSRIDELLEVQEGRMVEHLVVRLPGCGVFLPGPEGVDLELEGVHAAGVNVREGGVVRPGGLRALRGSSPRAARLPVEPGPVGPRAVDVHEAELRSEVPRPAGLPRPPR